MKPSGIGGMAVMEGVMMKNKDEYAVAVRKPDHEIVVEKNTYKDFSDKVKLFKLPIFRGMLAFVDSMVVGIKVLNFSASFFEEEDEAKTGSKEKSGKKKAEQTNKKDADFEVEEVSAAHSNAVSKDNTDSDGNAAEDDKKDEKSNALLMLFAVLISIVLSVTLFMVIPVLITKLISGFITSNFLITLIEGLIRLGIFIGYVVLAALMPDIKRVFMYHGAEHKTINCLENGFELTLENVRWQSKQHKRCGTSFMLLVILISLVLFLAIPPVSLLWRVLSRILLVPFIAGISYEFIRVAGKSENKIVNIISKPGLWMQGLTTKEPDDSMIEVAIQSVDAVFDWRGFLKTYAQEKTDNKKAAVNKPVTAKLTATEVKTKTSDEVLTQENATSAQAETAATVNKPSGAYDAGKRNTGATPINFKPVLPSRQEEEDDEILKALDKFFDDGQKEKKDE